MGTEVKDIVYMEEKVDATIPADLLLEKGAAGKYIQSCMCLKNDAIIMSNNNNIILIHNSYVALYHLLL